MTNKHGTFALAAIAILLVLASAATALSGTISYESAAVGRIVGDSPAELQQQLGTERIDLSHATYFARDEWWFNSREEEKRDVIRSQFPGRNAVSESWDWTDVQAAVHDFVPGEYFLLESTGRAAPLEMNGLLPAHADSWRPAFASTKPLFVMDSEYAGIYLPKQDTFMGRLGQDALTIAPGSYASREFTKALVCNLGRYERIGDVYRQARNNYYWGVQADDELVGLTLLSYMLYGNPLATVTVPHYHSDVIEANCQNYLRRSPEQEATVALMATGSAEDPYTKRFTFDFTDYTFAAADGYTIIMGEQTGHHLAQYELVLPKQVIITEFPLRTVVKDVQLVSLENPKEFIIEGLPSWNGTAFTDRTCTETKQKAGIAFSHTFTEDKEMVLVEVNPVEVLDCKTGHVRIYENIVYNLSYIPYSDVIIQSVDYPHNAAPGSALTLHADLRNVKAFSVSGTLAVLHAGKTLATADVSLFPGEESSSDISFTLPETEGPTSFKLSYMDDDGDLLTQKAFSITINTLKLYLQAPAKINAGTDAAFTLTVVNNGPPIHVGKPVYERDSFENDLDGWSDTNYLQRSTAWATDGSYSLDFYSGYVFTDMCTGSCVAQTGKSVDLTPFSSIRFDANIIRPTDRDDVFQFAIMCADDVPNPGCTNHWNPLFTTNDAGTFSKTIDVSSYTGVHRVVFRVGAGNSIRGAFMLDNVVFSSAADGSTEGNGQELTYAIMRNGEEQSIAPIITETTIATGETLLPFTAPTAGLEPAQYLLEAALRSATSLKTAAAFFLITHTAPVAPELAPLDDIRVVQGERVVLKPQAIDLNGDFITYSFLAPVDASGSWQTGTHDDGEYDITVTASDGSLTDETALTITVVPEDRLTTFSDDEAVKTLAFDEGPGRKTVYLNVLKKAVITSATARLSP